MYNPNSFVAFAQFNEQLLEDFAQVLAACDDPGDYIQVKDCARCVGICLSDLTTDDQEWLNKRVTELRYGGNY